MSKSAPALVFDRLFSYTISLVILAETLLIFFYFHDPNSDRDSIRTSGLVEIYLTVQNRLKLDACVACLYNFS